MRRGPYGPASTWSSPTTPRRIRSTRSTVVMAPPPSSAGLQRAPGPDRGPGHERVHPLGVPVALQAPGPDVLDRPGGRGQHEPVHDPGGHVTARLGTGDQL